MVNPRSAYETAGRTAGTLVSTGFPYLIALLSIGAAFITASPGVPLSG